MALRTPASSEPLLDDRQLEQLEMSDSDGMPLQKQETILLKGKISQCRLSSFESLYLLLSCAVLLLERKKDRIRLKNPRGKKRSKRDLRSTGQMSELSPNIAEHRQQGTRGCKSSQICQYVILVRGVGALTEPA